jgi:predicted amidophosphoribosyltransferase
MRDRHFPRLCRSCDRPMARQEDTCWRCGAQWASEAAARTSMNAVARKVPTLPAAARARRFAAAVPAIPSAASQARADADRWLDEGGSFAFEAHRPFGAALATK